MNDILPERKHPRLKSYEYSQNGAYFITLCTKNRAKLLGDVVGRDVLSNVIKLSNIRSILSRLRRQPLSKGA